MSLSVGALVISGRGRDSGVVMAVIAINETHAVLANGRKRRIEKPKLKNIKHVELLDVRLNDETVAALEKGELTNRMLYNGIKQSLNG